MLLTALATLAILFTPLLPLALAQAPSVTDPLPYGTTAPQAGNRGLCEGDNRQRESQVRTTQERIATFDQDGTLWVEHPVYAVLYCLDHVGDLEGKPELKDREPFRTVLRRPGGNGQVLWTSSSKLSWRPKAG